ncbi:hypothetical protein HAALTHF_17010n [Vreelandella aquamarina]|nr:hypothetical protein HAALTHF_17010n [Halomonas axialensis]
MKETQDATNLTELIHTMERMERENAQVSVDDVVHAVGETLVWAAASIGRLDNAGADYW